jgi:hypothetical protein
MFGRVRSVKFNEIYLWAWESKENVYSIDLKDLLIKLYYRHPRIVAFLQKMYSFKRRTQSGVFKTFIDMKQTGE